MDGAEKLLSISQCQMTVVYSVTVLSALGRKHSSVMVVKGGSTESAPQLDKSTLVFFSLILRTKLPIVLNQFQILIMSVPEKILIIGDCLIFKHIMKSKLLCIDFYCF
jgi:hypothetical protein